MVNLRLSIIATAVIFMVVGAGVAYIDIPAVEPNYNANNIKTTTQTVTQTTQQTVTQTGQQTGVISEEYKSWQNESYIYDYNLKWSLMNQTQMNLTINQNSKIFAQFSAPFLLSLDAVFSTEILFEVSLIIEGPSNTVVANTTVPIYYYDGSSTGSIRQMNYYPTLTVMTNKLSAGTYNCSIHWISTYDAPGSNFLSVGHHSTISSYHFDRWMMVQEIG